MISTPVSHADLWSLNPLDKRQSKPNTRFEQLPFLSSKLFWLFTPFRFEDPVWRSRPETSTGNLPRLFHRRIIRKEIVPEHDYGYSENRERKVLPADVSDRRRNHLPQVGPR
jgi:hypothetical protein